MEFSLDIVRYCAEEVSRQQDDPVAVWWLCDAWCKAMDAKISRRRLDAALIESWGRIVSQRENVLGFRRVNVRVGADPRPDWREVQELMARWVKNLDTMTPEEAYRTFEEIHPFRDGNGRTGKIIFNYLKNTLSSPVMPPNFWNCANP